MLLLKQDKTKWSQKRVKSLLFHTNIKIICFKKKKERICGKLLTYNMNKPH